MTCTHRLRFIQPSLKKSVQSETELVGHSEICYKSVYCSLAKVLNEKKR